MAIINRIGDFHDDMTAWRRDLHAHPELGFEEVRTSAFVAEKLRSFGLDEVHTGLARTGVVGVLRAGSGRGTFLLFNEFGDIKLIDTVDLINHWLLSSTSRSADSSTSRTPIRSANSSSLTYAALPVSSPSNARNPCGGGSGARLHSFVAHVVSRRWYTRPHRLHRRP